MKTCNFKSRKAISTIIGTFFFVIVMVGAFTAFVLMMQTNSNFLNTQLDTTQNEIQKIQGQFTIAAAYDATGTSKRLCVSVKNAGSTPLEIADLIIVNKTSNEARVFDIDFRDAFVPVSSIRQILANQPITLTAATGTGTIYDIKVVSTSGVMQTTELKVFPTSSPDPRFNVTAFISPINAASGQNVTIGAHVFNRMNTTLLNVQPNGDPLVDPAETVALGFNYVTRANITRLDPNESTVFMWEPEFVGGVGSKLNFTVRAKALVEGCDGSNSYIFNQDSALLKVVPGVRRQILAAPETFVSFPNPFGDANAGQTGVFSIVVQNPTDHGFKVSRVTIQVVNPTGEDEVTAVTGISPSSGTWTEGTNIIYWTNSASPIFVPANDIKEWVVRAEPTNIATTTPVSSLIFSTYSTFGQFGRGPFTHGVDAGTTALVSVYSKSTFSGTTPTFVITDIPSGTTSQRFNFTIENTGPTSVSSGSFMLINTPPGLRDITNVTNVADDLGMSTGLAVGPSLEFDDGSTQIPVRLTSDLTTGQTRTYSFRATMPSISVPAFYTFTIVANGTATDGVLIGPSSEVVLQVCPTSGTSLCP